MFLPQKFGRSIGRGGFLFRACFGLIFQFRAYIAHKKNCPKEVRDKMLSSFFGAYDAYYVSVFEDGVFADSSFVSGVDGVDEAFSEFCVD